MLIWLIIWGSLISLATLIVRTKKGKKSRLRKYLKSVLTIMAVFIMCILFRLFFFEVYYIPSGSMENTLFKGDFVLVSKLNYGPRFPKSLAEVPWLNILSSNSLTQKTISKLRLSGFTVVKPNDILVFNYVNDVNEYYVKRCIGLPGEYISLTNGQVFINGLLREDNGDVKKSYSLKFTFKGRDFSKITDSLHINFTEDWFSRRSDSKVITLNKREKDRFESVPEVQFTKTNGLQSYPDSFKPIWIPKKGNNIILDNHNIKFYQSVIIQFENKNLGGSKNYTFKQDYYFLMGDNRNASSDSRAWGVLPQNYIVGKAIMVIFSYDELQGVRWNRIFKLLN